MSAVSINISNYLNTLFGEEYSNRYIEFIKDNPVVYLRANSLRINPEKLAELLRIKYNISTELVPEVSNALKVTSEKDLLGKTLEHTLGKYYIQGLSSMLPPLILLPSKNDITLDLCAAPGSKTTQLVELMENKGTLIANEVQLSRLKSLVFNLDRINAVNAGVIHTKGELLSKFYSDYFDKILVDAPCSGLGIIQKKDEINDWWSIDRISRLGDLQLRLLVTAIKMLKTGGEIVYSTCTLTVEENEFILDKVLQKYPVEIQKINLPVPSIDGITEYNGKSLNKQIKKAKRILPWQINSDGFFIVKLIKTGSTFSPEKALDKQTDFKLFSVSNKKTNKIFSAVSNKFGLPTEKLTEYKFLMKNNKIFFVDKNWESNYLSSFERIGTRFGVLDKNDEIVLHTQAAQLLGNFISKRIFEIHSIEELQTYLEGGTIKNVKLETGQYAVKFEGEVIGTAVCTNEGLKSRFPRSNRTHKISLEY